MQAVILAAGKGTRLQPFTNVLPKPLLPLGGIPIIETLARQLAFYGYDEIFVTSHHLSNVIDTYLPSLSAKLPNVLFHHIPQIKLMGTTGGLSSIDGLGTRGAFLVMNGDHFSDMNYRDLMAYHQAQARPTLTVGTFVKKVKISLGVLDITNGTIRGYHEKPEQEYTVSTGVYIYEPDVLHYVPADDWQDAPELVTALIEADKTVAAFPFNGYWLDVGTMDDFVTAGDIFQSEQNRFLPDGA
jgi:NDP-sugar pyrophosphorylase family protein